MIEWDVSLYLICAFFDKVFVLKYYIMVVSRQMRNSPVFNYVIMLWPGFSVSTFLPNERPERESFSVRRMDSHASNVIIVFSNLSVDFFARVHRNNYFRRWDSFLSSIDLHQHVQNRQHLTEEDNKEFVSIVVSYSR